MEQKFSKNLNHFPVKRKNNVLIKKNNKTSIPKLTAMILFFIILLSFPNFGCNNEQRRQSDEIKQEEEKQVEEPDKILTFLGNSFVEKIDKDYHAIVNFTLTDCDIAHHMIICEKQFQVSDSLHAAANFTFKSSLEHYNKIYRGEITGFTSMGRANLSESTPLDFEFHKPVTDNPMNDLLFFVQRFFNPSPNDKVLLSKEKSRIVHGGHAIPLFYQKTDEMGVRSAWYQINKGQQVNEPGDTNPFTQYFIITKGMGFARIGKDTLRVKENEAYYIAPGYDHVFWTDSEKPMEMIFLAWGDGA